MTNTSAKAGGVAWTYFRRWILAGRVFRIAVQVRLLTLATVGVLATIGGWWLITQAFSGADTLKPLLQNYKTCPWNDYGRGGNFMNSIGGPFGAEPELGKRPANATIEPWRQLTAPAVQLLEVSRTFVGAAFLSLCILWAAAVWGFFGGAITRGTVLQLAREEAAPLGSLARHAGKRWLSYFSAPLFPLIGVVLVSLGLLFLGLLMRGTVLGASIFWPLALIGGVVMAILMAGASIGWPMMHAAISAEGNDSFDALSRSYSYVYQRPMHYLLYIVAATILGLLGLFVAEFFADMVWGLTAWGVSWGSGAELMQKADNASAFTGTTDKWGAHVMKFWHGGLHLVVIGFAFSYFWAAASAVYLLLRHEVDGADLDEVYLDETPAPYGGPSLATGTVAATPSPQPTAPAAEPVPESPIYQPELASDNFKPPPTDPPTSS